MIKACICTFNDDATLEFTISSLIGYVDEIIAIDGPWKNYSNDLCSTDGTIDILEKYGAQVHLGRYKNQVDKRNAYIKVTNTNDWILVIDADELLWNGYFLTKLDQYDYTKWGVNILSINYPANLYPGANKAALLEITPKQNRLFKKHETSHYWKKHFYLFHDGFNNAWLQYAPLSPLAIIHIHFLRPHIRKQEKLDYYVIRENLKEEGRGHFSFWLFDDCWNNCIAFQKDEKKAIDYQCSSLKDNFCRAHPGNFDLRGNKQIGPLIL